MDRISAPGTPVQRLAVALRWALAAVGFAVLVVAWAVSQDAVSYEAIFTDAVQYANLHPLVGVVSMIGLFLWAAAAAIAFQASAVLWRQDGNDYLARFLVATGMFTTVLLLDDAFMLHETVLPAIGVREAVTKLGYIALLAAYLAAFRFFFLRWNRTLALAAWGCLGASLVADSTVVFKTFDLERFPFFMFALEDGLKLAGISLWLAFVAKTATDILRPACRWSVASDGPPRPGGHPVRAPYTTTRPRP